MNIWELYMLGGAVLALVATFSMEEIYVYWREVEVPIPFPAYFAIYVVFTFLFWAPALIFMLTTKDEES